MTAPTEPIELTLEEAIALLTETELFLAREQEYDGWYWFVHDLLKDGEMVTKAFTWPEAVSAALGRPVVARDDAAELRAALTDWARADRTASEAHNAWLSEAAKGGASYTGNKSISTGQRRWAESLPSFRAWVRASTDRYTAEQRLQELARAALAATEGES